MEQQKPLVEFLNKEYTRRQSLNKSYSLRAFAQSLGVSRTALCEGLTLRRQFSKRNLLKMNEKFVLPDTLLNKALSVPLVQKRTVTHPAGRTTLNDDQFKIIADWYHLAILNLVKLKNFNHDPQNISRRLGIGVFETKRALTRLKRLGLLVEADNGQLKRVQKSIYTGNQMPTAAIHRFHRQNLELALQALDRDDRDRRENHALTMAIDPTKLPLIRPVILKFYKQIEKVLETEDASSVYTMTIQLFEATQRTHKEK